MHPASDSSQNLDALRVAIEHDLVTLVPFLIARLALIHSGGAPHGATMLKPPGHDASPPIAA